MPVDQRAVAAEPEYLSQSPAAAAEHREVGALALLQQDDQDQEQADHDVNRVEEVDHVGVLRR